jgi:hypothetical protein
MLAWLEAWAISKMRLRNTFHRPQYVFFVCGARNLRTLSLIPPQLEGPGLNMAPCRNG